MMSIETFALHAHNAGQFNKKYVFKVEPSSNKHSHFLYSQSFVKRFAWQSDAYN